METTGLGEAASSTRSVAEKVALSTREIAAEAVKLQKLAAGFLSNAIAA